MRYPDPAAAGEGRAGRRDQADLGGVAGVLQDRPGDPVRVAGRVNDPVELAALAKERLRSKTDRLVEALANRFRVTHHGVLVRRLLAHIDSLDDQLAALDEKITVMVAPIADLVDLVCTIPGVAPNTAHVPLAEWCA
jgi:transposase